MKSVRKLFRLLAPHNKNLQQIWLMAALQGVFYLAIPLGIQAIVTYIMSGQMSASLILLCSLTIVAVVFLGIFQLWQLRINETIQHKLLVDVAVRFSEKISMLKPELYLNSFLPSKINHFFDVLTLQKGLTKILLDFTFSLISIVFGLIVLSLYNTLFLLFAAITAFVFYLLIREYGNRALQTSYDESTKKYLFVNWLQTLYQGLKQKDETYTMPYIEQQASENLLNYIEEKKRHFKVLDIQYRGILIFKILLTAIILFFGIWLVQSGFLNIGQFVASEIIVILIINAVEKLVMNLQTVYEVLTATEKLQLIFELDEDTAKSALPNNFKKIERDVNAQVYSHSYPKKTKRLIYSMVIVCFVVLFLPWNQTIRSNGSVSTLNPSDRPQAIPSRISGRIEKWFVKEGDHIMEHDTIAFISEVKEDYFDPKLVERTQQQVNSKEASISSYEQKIKAINAQIDAINSILPLKLEQAKNKLLQNKAKVVSDSVDYVSSSTNFKITEEQFKRYEELLEKGIISKTDYENRKAKVQDSYAKKVASENKWINTKNDLLNSKIELSSLKQDYNEKLMKAESEKFSVMSALYESEAGLSKMQNQLSNYSIRNNYYYVTAPQNGFIVKSYVQGVGDIVKEGTPLVGFVPENNDFSVEFYIEPMDLPLVHKNMNVQLQFDGWPAFVFSGWPGISFGTYHASVVSIDKVISPNGKFRVLAKKDDEDWPPSIQVGSGVKGLVLLKTVPVFYECWRKINGFPPEFYNPEENIKTKTSDEKTKK